MIFYGTVSVQISQITRYPKYQTKFTEILIVEEQHPIFAKENSIEYYIRKYLKKYGKEIVSELIPSGSKPGKLYGLIKVEQ